MRSELLELKPTQYLCPYCQEWHDFPIEGHKLGDYNEPYGLKLQCDTFTKAYGYSLGCYSSYFRYGYFYYFIDKICKYQPLDMSGKIEISSIIESQEEPIVLIKFRCYSEKSNCESELNKCGTICRFRGLQKTNDCIEISLGFKFNKEEYDKIIGSKTKIEKEKIAMRKMNSTETTQTTKTTLWDQLYRHTPEENVEIVKQWAKKYRPTLQWAIPVVSIYAAYRILNAKDSKLTVDNINNECKKKLGFKLEALKDKKALSELMILGGLCAGAYAAVKAVSSIYKKDSPDDISVEDIEEGMEQLDGTAKKFSWIQPKTEVLLPVAVSVIIVYVMTQKPKCLDYLKEKVNKFRGDLSTRASVYADMIKLFIANKLNIDLNNEEEANKFKKFTLLAGIVAILAIAYGTKVLGNRAVKQDGEINKKIEIFISQILDIMKKLMPTAFVGATTYLITKNILKPEEKEEIEDESDEEDLEKESEGTEIASETEESSIQSLDETDKQ